MCFQYHLLENFDSANLNGFIIIFSVDPNLRNNDDTIYFLPRVRLTWTEVISNQLRGLYNHWFDLLFAWVIIYICIINLHIHLKPMKKKNILVFLQLMLPSRTTYMYMYYANGEKIKVNYWLCYLAKKN